MYIRFHKNVTDEYCREVLKKQLGNYVKEKNISIKNHPDLLRWVASGHSPYDNPYYICDDNCRRYDYLEAEKIEEEIYEMYESMSEEEFFKELNIYDERT